MMLDVVEAKWQAMQVEVLLATALRAAERLERAAAGAEPCVLNAVRLLTLAVSECCTRARLVRARVEAIR
jgi:hypothetical protein